MFMAVVSGNTGVHDSCFLGYWCLWLFSVEILVFVALSSRDTGVHGSCLSSYGVHGPCLRLAYRRQDRKQTEDGWVRVHVEMSSVLLIAFHLSIYLSLIYSLLPFTPPHPPFTPHPVPFCFKATRSIGQDASLCRLPQWIVAPDSCRTANGFVR